MTDDNENRPWSLFNCASLASAMRRIRPKSAVFHDTNLPTGPWWEETRRFVTLREVEPPREIFGNPLIHPPHRADILRMQILIDEGGISLDSDEIVHASFAPLHDNRVVIGAAMMSGETFLLGNGVMLAEPNARFVVQWLERYRSFRSKGIDEHWVEHSVEHSGHVPANAFHWPTWRAEHMALIFEGGDEAAVRGTYANHLWGTASLRCTSGLTPGQVRASDTPFHQWVRPYVAHLRDEFGAHHVA